VQDISVKWFELLHGSSVSIVTRLCVGQQVQFPALAGKGSSFFITASILALGPSQPPIQWVPGGSNHSPAKVKNVWSYTSTLQYIFIAWYLLKHKNNFTFTPETSMSCLFCMQLTFMCKIMHFSEL